MKKIEAGYIQDPGYNTILHPAQSLIILEYKYTTNTHMQTTCLCI